jgi:hypothetical protein
VAKQSEVYIQGLGELLRDFNRLPKDAAKELRTASKVIAEKHMVPAWKSAALTYAGPWGEDLANSVRAGSDRVPKIMIGGNRKVTSGGATANMLRFPADKGNRGRSGARVPAAFGSGSNWIQYARTYKGDAIEEWGKAVDRAIGRWAL